MKSLTTAETSNKEILKRKSNGRNMVLFFTHKNKLKKKRKKFRVSRVSFYSSVVCSFVDQFTDINWPY